MTPEQLQAIEDRWAKATRGPWHWDVNKSCKFVSLESRGHVAMGFKRYGMGGAQPTFLGDYALEPAEMLAVPRKANHPNFDMDINHPTAQAIASAPTDIADLLEEVRRLRCCGNCENWEIVLSYGSPVFKCKCESIVMPISTEKCDKWEAADNG